MIKRKLKSPDPTPENEICHCSNNQPIKLMSALGYNPFHCMICNLEVPLERLELALDVKTIDMVVSWRDIHDSLYRLWLDSNDYEEFASNQLTNINSRVNKLGREIQNKINNSIECYYWYFQDRNNEFYKPIENCPVCKREFTEFYGSNIPQKICSHSMIVTDGD
jgi:predicted  nucleic acid-binding Zn ribbon protein